MSVSQAVSAKSGQLREYPTEWAMYDAEEEQMTACYEPHQADDCQKNPARREPAIRQSPANRPTSF